MYFEYDPEKDQRNKKLHGIGFEEMQQLWEGTHVIVPAKNVRGEKRFAILGEISRKVYMAIYSNRRSRIRIISAHRADKRWESIYHEKIKEG